MANILYNIDNQNDVADMMRYLEESDVEDPLLNDNFGEERVALIVKTKLGNGIMIPNQSRRVRTMMK